MKVLITGAGGNLGRVLAKFSSNQEADSPFVLYFPPDFTEGYGYE